MLPPIPNDVDAEDNDGPDTAGGSAVSLEEGDGGIAPFQTRQGPPLGRQLTTKSVSASRPAPSFQSRARTIGAAQVADALKVVVLNAREGVSPASEELAAWMEENPITWWSATFAKRELEKAFQ
ncbi:hypothetical protein HK101_007121, partial [Irineochytrium annulatum]